MTDKKTVIEFRKVYKTYKLFKNDKKRLLSAFFKRVNYKEKKAVNGVSFKIKQGEAVALFGRNGAGKSTILKMITGVTYPTKGRVRVKGRVSALLELTSGFDPELSGIENIYLKGQLMGLKDKEIKEVEQDIINFADLEDYINQPVRTYSSGMKARLGFAVNVSINPEILIIDEALSVGRPVGRSVPGWRPCRSTCLRGRYSVLSGPAGRSIPVHFWRTRCTTENGSAYPCAFVWG